eukprot:jgi/Botrbrau1/9800/Bobra.0322s0008.1
MHCTRLKRGRVCVAFWLKFLPFKSGIPTRIVQIVANFGLNVFLLELPIPQTDRAIYSSDKANTSASCEPVGSQVPRRQASLRRNSKYSGVEHVRKRASGPALRRDWTHHKIVKF